jgi:hypothetical protein
MTAEVWHIACSNIVAVPESVRALIGFIIVIRVVIVVIRIGIFGVRVITSSS